MSGRSLRHGAVWAGAILLAAGAAAWLMGTVAAGPAAQRPENGDSPQGLRVPAVSRETTESRGLVAQPGAAEAAIERALAQPVEEFDFDQVPLVNVVAQLNRQYKIPVLLDMLALDAMSIDPSKAMITMSLRGISLGSALGLLLDGQGLTWTIRSEVLYITTPDVAGELLITRVYDVADLVLCRDETGVLWDDYDSLIDAIETTVEVDSWQDTGAGPGTIGGQTFGSAHVLIICNTRDVHAKVAKLLDDVRNVAAKAGPAQPNGTKLEDHPGCKW